MGQTASRNIGKDESIDDLLTEEILEGILRNSDFKSNVDKLISYILTRYAQGKKLTQKEKDFIDGVRVKKRIASIAIQTGQLSEALEKKYKRASNGTPIQKEALKTVRKAKTKKAKEEEAIKLIEAEGRNDAITRRRIHIFYMVQRHPRPSYGEIAAELGCSKRTVFEGMKFIPRMYGDVADKTTSEEHVRKEISRLESDLAEWRQTRRETTSISNKAKAQHQINKIVDQLISLKKQNGLIITVEQNVAIRSDSGEETEFDNQFWGKLEKQFG